jgi:glucosamine-6-phosphate deaminase
MKIADIKGYSSEANSSMLNDDAFVTRFEKITVRVVSSASAGSIEVAKKIVDLIKKRSETGGKVVLGLATGSTPLKVYNELIRWHKEDGLSFSNVITFNLDEYYPLEHDHQQSYNHFMWDRLFSKCF